MPTATRSVLPAVLPDLAPPKPPKIVRHDLTYWQDIFQHWKESGESLKCFCARVGYDQVKVYTAFYDKFYTDFDKQQRAIKHTHQEIHEETGLGEDEYAKLDQWEVMEGRLYGVVENHPKFPNGATIVTTKIKGRNKHLVLTECGQWYFLVEPSARFELVHTCAKMQVMAKIPQLEKVK